MRAIYGGLTLALLGGSALAAEPHLSDVRITLEDRNLSVSVELLEAFSDETLERIRTGLPTGFVYQFRLDRDRKRWFDASLAKSTLQVVAMYNAVTAEYLVNYKLDGELIESRVVRERLDLELALTRVAGVSIFNLEGIQTRDRMLVRARADLGSKTGFLFLPTRITTGWHRSRKFRASDGAR
jgi:hypothetical protein